MKTKPHPTFAWILGYFVAIAGILELGVSTTAAGDADGEFFEKQVRPVFVEHCHECHSGDETKGGLQLESLDDLIRGGDSGAAIEVGDSSSSLLISAIGYETDLQMPPDTRLDQEQVDAIAKWIDQGAIWPNQEAKKVTNQTNNDKANTDKTRQTNDSSEPSSNDDSSAKSVHWSFQSIVKPTPPNTDDKKWSLSAVDQFILSRLEAAGLRPAKVADRYTLIRRVHFDLTGLPPSASDVKRFVDDERPLEIAFTEVVDRLLADPAFGEKWARHWLDLVRYSETAGHVQDLVRPNAWRYRDYVIDAWNDDLAFDQFILESIAGDIVATTRSGRRGETDVTPAATGFLWFHEMHFKPVDPNAQRADQVDAQIDVVSKAFLGMTVACARCHDHKFDPVSQEDYYALAGFFHSTIEKVQRLHSLDNDDSHSESKRIQALLKQIQKLKRQGEKIARADRLQKTDVIPPISETVYTKGIIDKLAIARKQLAEIDRRMLLWAPAAAEGDATDVRMHVRGSHKNLGKPVPRRFLSALGGEAFSDSERASSSGRMFLAKQIASDQNPLTARVQVNRLWQHLFGNGLVKTANNFGTQGAAPTHPELLDYLASQLIENDWSNKSILRTIVLSRTYQLESRPSRKSMEYDPQNRLRQHQQVRRLSAEAIRDSLLLVSNALNRHMFGDSVPAYLSPNATANKKIHIPKAGPLDGNRRRSIYIRVRRNFLNPFLEVFDYPDQAISVAIRNESTSATQSLAMMNSPFVHQQAARLAAELSRHGDRDDAKFENLYVRMFARPIRAAEREMLEAFVKRKRNHGVSEVDAWTDLVHALFNLNEFIYLR